jgi:hypothetical protein
MVALRRSHPGIAVLLALLAPALRANTYTVDASGGAQFTDIQSAIAAAQPGDVLLVAGGTYPGFTLDKGIAIIGYNTVNVTGTAQVVNVQAPDRAALLRMRPMDVSVSGCSGAVLLEELLFLHSLSVTQSNDVRAARVTVYAYVGPHTGADAITIDHARLEFVDSAADADQGVAAGSPGFPTAGGTGGSGLFAGPSVRVHGVRSHVSGGLGGDAGASPLLGGNGGAGMTLTGPSEILLFGVQSNVRGGFPGTASYPPFTCSHDGTGGCAIVGVGTVRHSDGTILGGPAHCSATGQLEPAFCGPTDVPLVPIGPHMYLSGSPAPGNAFTLVVYGEPGAAVVLHIGRNPILAPTPGVDVEQLTGYVRNLSLGTIPASGFVAHGFVLHANLPLGLFCVTQAEVIGSGGLQRTNSVPIILR